MQGKALEFNQGSVKFEPLKVDELKALTIEFWFQPTKKFSGGNRMDMMYRKNGGGRPHITFNRGGVLFGHYFANKGAELEIRSKFVEFESKWYYFVATQDKKKAIMYIDGKIDGQAVSGSDVRFDYIKFGLSLADNSDAGGNFFNGATDEVKIWSVAFTTDEAQESMKTALAVDPAGKLTTKWA